MPDKFFAFVPFSKAEDYVCCGWLPHDSLQQTRHGEYAVLMEYIPCACKRDMPMPGTNRIGLEVERI